MSTREEQRMRYSLTPRGCEATGGHHFTYAGVCSVCGAPNVPSAEVPPPTESQELLAAVADLVEHGKQPAEIIRHLLDVYGEDVPVEVTC